MSHLYDVCGVGIDLESSLPAVHEYVARTYSAFAADALPNTPPLLLNVHREGQGVVLSDSNGHVEMLEDEWSASLATLTHMTELIVAGLADAGTLTVHAGAAAHHGRAVIMAGPSGTGKTTLALGLVSRGWGLLSDETAVIPPQGRTVLPYRRSVHIRPGTPELIPQLAFLHREPQLPLGGGIKWSLTPQELDQAFPGCLAAPARLTNVLLLAPPTDELGPPRLEPVSPAVAVVELAHGTPTAGHDLNFVLARLAALLGDVRCARLRPGDFEQSLETVTAWLDGGD